MTELDKKMQMNDISTSINHMDRNTEFILDSIHAAVFILDTDGKICLLRGKLLQKLHLDPIDYIGKEFKLFFSDIPQIHEGIVKALSGYECKNEFMLKDHYLEVHYSPVTEEDNSITGIIGTATDITAIKKTEEALQKSEGRFRSLADNIPGAAYDYFYHQDGTRSQQYMGPGLEEIIGKTLDDDSGKMDIVFSRIHPDDIDKIRREGKIAEETDTTLDCEYRVLSDFGNYIWVRSIGRATPETDGSYHWQGVLIDVTRQKRIEEERQKLRERFLDAQKKESLSILAGGIAHDFNNLLVGILGNASLALTEISGNPSLQRTIQAIEQSAERAAELTRQILAYSGKGHFIVEEFNLSDLVLEMNQLLKATVSRKAILQLNTDSSLPLIKGDISQFRQILLNLAINSSEALDNHTGFIIIKTGRAFLKSNVLSKLILGETRKEGLFVYLEVEDNGSGMKAETINKIFDPFFSTKFTGRGLGLASVLGIVEGHKGAIKVKSSENVGTTIRIYFPTVHEYDEDVTETRTTEDMKPTIATILVADDEPSVLLLAKRSLEIAGFRVLTANDGAECIRIVNESQDSISAIILDMKMPKYDGKETFDYLLENKFDIPVIISSGISFDETQREFRDYPVFAFLQKPYRPVTLINTVHKTLEL